MPEIGTDVVLAEGHRAAIAGVPMAQVLLQRYHQEEEGQQGHAQPQQATLDKGQRPAAVVGHHHEIAGDQEEQAHEERAVHREEWSEDGGPGRLLDRPRAAGRSIGLPDMVGDHENRQGDPEIIEEIPSSDLPYIRQVG